MCKGFPRKQHIIKPGDHITMNDGTLITNSVDNIQLPKLLYKRLRKSGYDKTLGFRNLSQEINDGKETLTGLLPSLLSEINLHSTKSEADLIHV
jgi:hypothetical protein